MQQKPKFEIGDDVYFTHNGETINGVIYIVDTIDYSYYDEASYDVMDQDKNMLYKHVKESDLTRFEIVSENNN